MKRFLSVLVITASVCAACSSGSSDNGVTAVATTSSKLASTTVAPAAVSTTSTVAPITTTTTAVEPHADLKLRLVEAIDAWMTDREIPVPGLSLAVRTADGSLVTLARGVSDLKTGKQLSTADYFRIGSISKTITAATVLDMVEDGLIGLDDPVSKYLGDWLPGYVINGVDYGSKVTVRQLLGHTDGFKEYAWDLGFYDSTSRRLDKAFDPREIVDWGLQQGPQFVPGEDYNYNTVGPVAAGLVIEAVSGRRADQEIRSRLFEPLHLDHIFLPPGEVPPVPIVHGYAVDGLRDILDSLPALEALKADASIDGGTYFDIMAAPQEALDSVGWTGGGVESQAGDLAILFASLFDGTLLSPESVDAMTTPNPYASYGLSLDIGERNGHPYYNKGGGVPGFRSMAGYLPDSGVSVALLANSIFLEPDVGDLMDQVLSIIESQ